MATCGSTRVLEAAVRDRRLGVRGHTDRRRGAGVDGGRGGGPRVLLRRGDSGVARGGGTSSLAGQTVNEAVVLDLTGSMDEVLSTDPEAGTARAQAGAYVGDLNAAVEPHGLKFAPDPAWRDKSAIGGAIGNNSTGSHSLKYGKTDHYVEELEVVLADGTVTTFGEVAVEELRESADAESDDLLPRIHAEIVRILDEEAGAIDERFPEMKRNVSGYNLDRPARRVPRRVRRGGRRQPRSAHGRQRRDPRDGHGSDRLACRDSRDEGGGAAHLRRPAGRDGGCGADPRPRPRRRRGDGRRAPRPRGRHARVRGRRGMLPEGDRLRPPRRVLRRQRRGWETEGRGPDRGSGGCDGRPCPPGDDGGAERRRGRDDEPAPAARSTRWKRTTPKSATGSGRCARPDSRSSCRAPQTKSTSPSSRTARSRPNTSPSTPASSRRSSTTTTPSRPSTRTPARAYSTSGR